MAEKGEPAAQIERVQELGCPDSKSCLEVWGPPVGGVGEVEQDRGCDTLIHTLTHLHGPQSPWRSPAHTCPNPRITAACGGGSLG